MITGTHAGSREAECREEGGPVSLRSAGHQRWLPLSLVWLRDDQIRVSGGRMKLILSEQAPYRSLPLDCEEHYSSVCNTPYSLTTKDGVYSSVRDFVDELLAGARAGFDGIAVTEHGQTSSDMMPNPDVVAGALAYVTHAEGLDVAIHPMGQSLGQDRHPVR